MGRLLIIGANSASARSFFAAFGTAFGETHFCDLGGPLSGEPAGPWHVCDLASYEEVSRVVRAAAPDRICNFAGTFSNDYAVDYAANVLLPKHIFDAVLELRLQARVLLIGSSAEYGLVSVKDNPVAEEHPLNPVSVYGLTKVFQTQLMKYYVQARGIDAVMARPFNLLSPHMSDRLFVGRLYRQIRQYREGAIDKIVLGNLDSRRDYIRIEEAVKAYAVILGRGRSGEVYNVGSGFSVRIFDLLQQILQENGLGMEVVQSVDRQSGAEVSDIYADIAKLKQLGG